MTMSRPQRNKLISAVQELATASSSDGLRAVLGRHRFLTSAETDRQLTRAIQAGLERNGIATVSVLFTVRGFLERLRNDGIESALAAIGGVPLFQADPIGQLIRNPQPSPRQVDLCHRALEAVRRDTEPSLWAYLHFLLADRLMLAGQAQASRAGRQPDLYFLPTDHLPSSGQPAHVQQAMDAYEVAAGTWEACGELEQAAGARYELARLLVDFTGGEGRAAALGRAIKLLESTSSVWTRDTHPQEWGDVQALLGLALKNMPGGLDAPTLERAIGLYKEALPTPIDPSLDPSFEKARRRYHLATLYAQRYRDDRTDNVERAVELLRAALKAQARDAYPEEWADTQNGLANALQQRLRGDPAQNMERAIGAYKAALQVWTRKRNPTRWATIQRNLAEAYRHRILGQPEKNQEEAIAHFGQALNVYTRHEHPTQWASVHNSLANLYCNRLRGERAGNIEEGIRHYERALEVYTRAAYPRQWAQTTNNLANAYCERMRGDHAGNLRDAIALYEQVLEVRTEADYPREWAATHNNIGTAYDGLGQLERAAEHFQRALHIRTVETLPDKTLQTSRNLGRLYFGLGRWRQAIDAYGIAQKASDTLYRQAITEAGKRAEIGRSGEIAHHIAYALAEEGELPDAVLALEGGRARLLAEALARDRAVLEQASDGDRAEYESAVRQVRARESELRAAELNAQGATDAPTTARPFAEIAEDLSSANEELDRIAKSIGVLSHESPAAQSRLANIAEAAQPDMPLVYLTATSAGGLAIIVHNKGVKRVWLRDLTDEALLEQARKWFGAYFTYLQAQGGSAAGSARQAWFDVLKTTTHWLWDVLMGELIATLEELGHCRATLIPTGFLAFFPLHAAWHSDAEGSSCRYALDDVAFAYAPSARALIHARRIAAAASGETLFAVNNPDGSLHYAGQEVSAVTRHFSAPWVADRERATRSTALLALPQCDVYHFACHGNNDWQSPLESALQMYSQDSQDSQDNQEVDRPSSLTVADLLGLKERLQARLAFLSACETGLVGTELPDEMVGLAAGFMQAGAASVISSLWAVNDESTAILAAQFYENWKGKGMSPLEALVAAQRSVRDEGDNGGWAHPYYWAAFTLTGV